MRPIREVVAPDNVPGTRARISLRPQPSLEERLTGYDPWNSYPFIGQRLVEIVTHEIWIRTMKKSYRDNAVINEGMY